MSTFSGTERRKYLRVSEEDLLVCEPFSASAFEKHGFHKTNAFTKNLSEGGLLFESDTFFEMGALLKLEIDIPGWEKFNSKSYKGNMPSGRHPLVVLGKVVRVEDIGARRFDIGVTFTAVDAGHKLALKKYLEREAKDKKA